MACAPVGRFFRIRKQHISDVDQRAVPATSEFQYRQNAPQSRHVNNLETCCTDGTTDASETIADFDV